MLLKQTLWPPCRDSIYSLQQDVKDHIDQCSHPCRFD